MNTNSRAMLLILILLFINGTCWAVSSFFYKSLSVLILSYTLGLRHALDPDHIAAIDNATRCFIRLGQKPVTVGMYFALGHSTIVFIASLLVAAISQSILDSYDANSKIASTIGSSFAVFFLVVLGIINCLAISSIIKGIKDVQKGQPFISYDSIIQNGFFAKLFGTKFIKVIDRPYKMYFVGFLFGLGFDTATEISLLSITAMQATVSAWAAMFLPLLFFCGMALVDSIDSIIMLRLYRFSTISAIKKLFLNLFLTAFSVFFAFSIALIKFFGIFQSYFTLEGPFWDFITFANDDNNGVFLIASLAGSALLGFAAGWYIYYHVLGLNSKNASLLEDSINIQNSSDAIVSGPPVVLELNSKNSSLLEDSINTQNTSDTILSGPPGN